MDTDGLCLDRRCCGRCQVIHCQRCLESRFFRLRVEYLAEELLDVSGLELAVELLPGKAIDRSPTRETHWMSRALERAALLYQGCERCPQGYMGQCCSQRIAYRAHLEHVQHHQIAVNPAHGVATEVGVEKGVAALDRYPRVPEEVVLVDKGADLEGPVKF